MKLLCTRAAYFRRVLGAHYQHESAEDAAGRGEALDYGNVITNLPELASAQAEMDLANRESTQTEQKAHSR